MPRIRSLVVVLAGRLSAVVLTTLVALPVLAWENEKTHPALTDEAVIRFRIQGEFDKLLQQNYGLSDGVATQLGIQRDTGPAKLQADLATNRFAKILKVSFFTKVPVDLRVEINDRCATGPDFDECFANFERYPIDHLLRAGVFGEDNPNIRASHHFHDPARTHGSPRADTPAGFPADNRGQDNTTILFDGTFDEDVARLVTKTRGGGDFRLFGRSARDRALRLRNAEEGETENVFDLPSSERYLYRAFTADTPNVREHFMALHFIALGSVLHLLEDMTSVAHTRNDFILDHILLSFGSLESKGANSGALRFIQSLSVFGDEFLVSTPNQFLVDQDSARFSGMFQSQLPNVDASSFSASDFWDRADGLQALNALGVAELVNRHFFSEGTLSNELPAEDPLSYPFPLLPSCEVDGAELGTGTDRVVVRDLPRRVLKTGGPNTRFGEVRFLSSALVPHLARCTFHSRRRAGTTVARQGSWTVSTKDESVQRDYLEILFPLAVDYAEKFLRYYFQPRIDIVPLGGNSFELYNRSSLEFTASIQELRIYYDDTNGTRSNLLFSCDVTDSTFSLLPGEKLACQMPASLPGGAAPPSSRGNFSVVIRGQLGDRGTIVTPADSWEEAEFVTAVRRVLGWRVAYEGVRPGDRGDLFNPPADVEDRALVRDVYEIAFDLDTGSNPTFIPTSVVTNLTQPYRDQLSSAFSEQVDFMAPSSEPDGSRIAFSSDIRIEAGMVLDVSQGSEVGFFAASDIHVIDMRALESVETIPPAPLGDLPSCDFACPPAWDRNSSSDTIYFSVGGSSPVVVLSESLARHELGGTTTSTLLGSRNVAAVSAYNNLVAGTASLLDGGGASPIPIYLTDVATGEASFLIDLESFSVIACDDPSDPSICAPGDSPETFYGADPEFSPDGSRLALIVYDQPIIDPATGTNSRHHGSVYVADLGMPAAAGGTVSLIAAADGQAKHPTWSPDGDWIAYTREDDGHLYVVSTTGGIPMRVSQAIAGRSGLTWLPSLLLPQ